MHYDVIVVGGGHAGVEAAAASARLGASTLLLTHNIETIGQMSCNPAIGGIGKGHLVKEIDALGGLMAKAIDLSGIQWRTLNASKGPAVRATRAQADRALYRSAIRTLLDAQKNLVVFQAEVSDLLLEGQKVSGVQTQLGLSFYAKAVVLTVGTFLGGKMHIGEEKLSGGRAGDRPANALSQRLRALPFSVGRLKTGTPPRIDGRTIDLNRLEIQPGDTPLPVFSFLGSRESHPKQVPCYIAKTTSKTHEIILANLHRSAIYGGQIDSVGPRYCPSIEDKVVRFKERDSHQIFVEPEGLDTFEIYPNGISTSLPFEVQKQFVQSMEGFENAHLTRPGYAIEYDFFDPRGLNRSLETKLLEGLFFAGQINGTTGYEEAAAQGLLAGANAALHAGGRASFTLGRQEAYLGVLVDDLITQGTQEPYRMFTSRAEYRLLLREDNADLRLTQKGFELGLVCAQRIHHLRQKKQAIAGHIQQLEKTWVQPETAEAEALEACLNEKILRAYSLENLLVRPELSLADLVEIFDLKSLALETSDTKAQIEIQVKYKGYIQRQEKEIAKNKQAENQSIPKHFEYANLPGLSLELKEKLALLKPETLGIASRIPGMTPAAVSLLRIYLKKQAVSC